MAKDKKKKTRDKKDKKAGKTASVAKAPKRAAKKTTKNLKALSQNPLVADVVASALVAMASALRDSDKARRLANEAGAELEALAKKGAKQGNAMWDMALEIGQRTLDALGEGNRRGKGAKSR